MNRTKAAIVSAFWQLLNEKSYSQITVKDIVTRCMINRNTFYYHFHDIPELLEYSFKDEIDHIIQTYSRVGCTNDSITPFLESGAKQKKALLHIYRSVHREIFLKELERLCFYIVKEYVNTVTDDLPLRKEDKDLLIRFYKCTLVGTILDWMDHSMDYDLQKAFERICNLFAGTGKQAFLKSVKPERFSKTQTSYT
ncbi:MAG: TetR/AcrR family transcriptional regulator [Lachnospiraceae bacterium]|nr:TetR/AcrR family transcriptional regulator [Lachnospiraceae bacterium]